MTDRKPSTAVWLTVALVAVLVGYPLSFGPACWIACREPHSTRCVARAYCPLVWAATDSPRSIQRALTWYAELFWPPFEFESVAFSAGFSTTKTVKIGPVEMLRAASR
jgi:hypothetical protein